MTIAEAHGRVAQICSLSREGRITEALAERDQLHVEALKASDSKVRGHKEIVKIALCTIEIPGM